MKLLLGATVALLFTAVILSWQGMRQGVGNAGSDEVERLRKQIAELRQEHDKLELEKQLQQLRAAGPSSSTEIDSIKAEIEANKAAIAQMEAEKAARDERLKQDEEGLLQQRDLEGADQELRRARWIAEALLMGRVREYHQEGGFIIFDVLMPDQVQPGTVLAIRRKTGILAQFKVGEVTPEGGIADPMPGFGPIDPMPGDELILPPQY